MTWFGKYCLAGLALICYAWMGGGARAQTNPMRGQSGDSDLFWALDSMANRFMEDSTAIALQLAVRQLAIARKNGNEAQRGLALLNLANCHLFIDFYDQALHYASDALHLLKKHGAPDAVAKAYATLGWTYYDAENTESALAMHQEALNRYRAIGDMEQISIALNSLGLVHAQGRRFDQALTLFNDALAINRQMGQQRRIAVCLNNIGMCESALERYDQALRSLDEAMAIAQILGGPLLTAEIFNQKGNAHLHLRQFEQAEADLLQSRALIEKASSNARKEKLMDNYDFSAALYALKGDFAKAYFFLKKYGEARNDILSEEKNRKLAEKRLWYETSKREMEIKALEQEKSLQNLQRNALAAGLALLAVIAFLTYSRMRNDRRKERELAEMRAALMQKEIEREALEKATLNRKVAYKNRELTNFALDLSQKNELLRSAGDEIEAIELQAPQSLATRLRQTAAQIRHGLEINREAEAFHLHIEAEYKDFYFNLQQHFPDLTKNEKRLCAQLRLDLSNKDIASLNNISVKSVEMARYRLRKHLGLEHEENLTAFLQSF